MGTLTTGDLTIAYSDTGPRDGTPVLLIHGWPDDATTWNAVAPRLHAAGLRTIAPMLRGFGETRLREGVPRTGDSSILALDLLALMDALGVERFLVAGHDWGSNVAEALAVGWPDRVERMALLASPPRLGGAPTPPFAQAQRQWYHWFMATARGAEAVRADRRGFARRHWDNWSPPGWYDERTFERVARSWDNPDWVDVTIHSYRARWDEAEPDPRGRWLEDKVRATKTLSLPTLYLHGASDGINPPSTSEQAPGKFTGPFALVTLPGVGHFPQREDPDAVARHLVRLFTGDPARLVADRSSSIRNVLPAVAAGLAAAGLVAAVALARGRSGSPGRPRTPGPFVRYADDVEQVPADEPETIRRILDSLGRLHGRTLDKFGRPVRVSHGKAHGVAVGELVVAGDLPPELAQGLFAAPGRYPAIVRLANVPGEIDSDIVGTQRGLSVKILGVDGEMLPGHEGETTQDFVLDTGDRFAVADAKAFLHNHLLLEHMPQVPDAAKGAVSGAALRANQALHAVGGDSAALDFFGHPRVHPLAEAYFTQAPIRYGGYVAKLAVVPVGAFQTALAGIEIDPAADPDALRTATVGYLRDHDAAFDVRVQLCTDLTRMPVEDASVEWPEDESPYRTVARLVIPRQDAFSPARRDYVDEALSFCPSHGLAAHRPLGSIMRARLAAYPRMARVRREAAGRAIAEPRSVDEVPV